MPTNGVYNRLDAEASVPGSTLNYFKLGAKHRQYWPLYGDLVASVNGEIGYGDSYDSTSGLPFYQNYFIGGPSSIRGYVSRSIGPRDSGVSSASPTPDTGNPLGGNLKLLTNFELFVPSPIYSDTMRLVAFVDVGSVFNSSKKVDFNELRGATGVGLSWMSPMGPLALSYAKTLKEDAYDETESFQFTLGTVFLIK